MQPRRVLTLVVLLGLLLSGCAASPVSVARPSTPTPTPSPSPTPASAEVLDQSPTALEDPDDVLDRAASIDPIETVIATAEFDRYLGKLRAFYMDEPGAREELLEIASEEVVQGAEGDLAAIRAKGLRVRAKERLESLVVHLLAPPSHLLAFVCRDLAALDFAYESGETAPLPEGSSVMAQEVRLVNDPNGDGFIVDRIWPAPSYVSC